MREVLYGRQPVRETLRAGRRQVFGVLVAKGLRPSDIVGQIITLAERNGIPVQTVARRELDRLGDEVNHQGLAAKVSGYPYVELGYVLTAARQAGTPPLVLLLDHVQDPQNLGSLLRTAEAAGVDCTVIPERRAVGVTPAVVRASAGAAEHARVAQVTNLVQAMKSLQADDVWLVGLEAVPEALPYSAADLSGPLGLVIGSEGQGLSRLVGETCDYLIRLPLRGEVESLNAGVAGGIALYEVLRQRVEAARRGIPPRG